MERYKFTNVHLHVTQDCDGEKIEVLLTRDHAITTFNDP